MRKEIVIAKCKNCGKDLGNYINDIIFVVQIVKKNMINYIVITHMFVIIVVKSIIRININVVKIIFVVSNVV